MHVAVHDAELVQPRVGPGDGGGEQEEAGAVAGRAEIVGGGVRGRARAPGQEEEGAAVVLAAPKEAGERGVGQAGVDRGLVREPRRHPRGGAGARDLERDDAAVRGARLDDGAVLERGDEREDAATGHLVPGPEQVGVGGAVGLRDQDPCVEQAAEERIGLLQRGRRVDAALLGVAEDRLGDGGGARNSARSAAAGSSTTVLVARTLGRVTT